VTRINQLLNQSGLVVCCLDPVQPRLLPPIGLELLHPNARIVDSYSCSYYSRLELLVVERAAQPAGSARQPTVLRVESTQARRGVSDTTPRARTAVSCFDFESCCFEMREKGRSE
jgi:hypothetical protein